MASAKPFTDAQKANIVELFLTRVDNAERRRKIVRVAHALSEDEPMGDTFYATLYNYSKAENWERLEEAYSEFVVPGDFGAMNDELNTGTFKRTRKGTD